MQSYGHYRLWPNLWWAEESSNVGIPITNSTVYSNTYLTSAGYTHTGFWVGAKRLLPEGQALVLSEGGQGTAVIPLRMEDNGFSPDDGSPVDLLVLGATDTGLYYVADTQVNWTPVRIEMNTGILSTSPAGYSSLQADEAPSLPYPLTSYVTVVPDLTDQQVTISAFNPFTITVSAILTQTIPLVFTILDTGGGQVIGNSIVWTGIITPQTDLEVRAILGWDGSPGQVVDMPGAVLGYRDPNTNMGDTYTTTVKPVEAAWPLDVSVGIPSELRSNVMISVPVTITNLADYTALGIFTGTVTTLDGVVLWSTALDVNLSPTDVLLLNLPITINTNSQYVVFQGDIRIGEVTKTVFFELLPNISYRIFLPLAVR